MCIDEKHMITVDQHKIAYPITTCLSPTMMPPQANSELLGANVTDVGRIVELPDRRHHRDGPRATALRHFPASMYGSCDGIEPLIALASSFSDDQERLSLGLENERSGRFFILILILGAGDNIAVTKGDLCVARALKYLFLQVA